MDLNRVLAELVRERDLIDEAIAHLEQLSKPTSSSQPRRRVDADKSQDRVRAAGGAFD
jgi:hypothetical protein